MYYLLTASFKSQETKLVELICSQPAVEKIYLLGSSLIQQRSESVFMPDAPSCRRVGHYDVLVLVNKSSNLQLYDLQDRIENTCRPLVPVTAILMHLQTFTEWLQQGRTFATTIVERAVLLHNKDEMPLLLPQPLPLATNDTGELPGRQQQMVSAFIAGAELYIQQQQNYLAMFMLHQAAEQALHCLLKQKMHWYASTHNLHKLLRYAAMVCYRVPDIFNRHSEEEAMLLQQLQDAYTGSRYKEDYQPSAITTRKALEKIKRLQQLIT